MGRIAYLLGTVDRRWIRVGWIVMALALAAMGIAADDEYCGDC